MLAVPLVMSLAVCVALDPRVGLSARSSNRNNHNANSFAGPDQVYAADSSSTPGGKSLSFSALVASVSSGGGAAGVCLSYRQYGMALPSFPCGAGPARQVGIVHCFVKQTSMSRSSGILAPIAPPQHFAQQHGWHFTVGAVTLPCLFACCWSQRVKAAIEPRTRASRLVVHFSPTHWQYRLEERQPFIPIHSHVPCPSPPDGPRAEAPPLVPAAAPCGLWRLAGRRLPRHDAGAVCRATGAGVQQQGRRAVGLVAKVGTVWTSPAWHIEGGKLRYSVAAFPVLSWSVSAGRLSVDGLEGRGVSLGGAQASRRGSTHTCLRGSLRFCRRQATEQRCQPRVTYPFLLMRHFLRL